MRLNPRTLLGRLPFRARLAAAISALFLVAGVALLAFVVLLARYGTAQQVQGIAVEHGNVSTYGDVPTSPEHSSGRTGLAGPQPARGRADGDMALIRKIDWTVQAVQDTALRQMVLWSAVGLLVMALLVGLLGWWLAGRALRPVTSMTEAARRISEQNLHQRLALTGPDDELQRLADTFDTMLERLEKSFESQRRFIANASHELRTPLAVQRASLQVGLADPLPEGLAEVREDLLTANREAEQLVNALLLLARSDRGLEETVDVDVAATAETVTAELAAQAAIECVDIGLTAKAPRPVLGDPLLLRHLLTNLIGNAVRHNRPGGHVRVRVEDRTVTVTNTGPLVSAEQIPALFEPFRRLAQDRTGTTGHGLGLSIADSIAKAHNAGLTAEPGEDGGLHITLSFA
ncbi:sensor histidine kinase [Streptomyces aurantiacus]|uniref:histidine kinase n=1 Tax=Streptomyces aurantiacus TaxID=47760 RepID=A0A7G1NSE3_9ACTN|nr:HAMP domain-containing sensor histidine kinase [Streptomyces aurantiacus]BCL25371.1 two-component sensor histidine kinase [Streptomyces aurantiacus]